MFARRASLEADNNVAACFKQQTGANDRRAVVELDDDLLAVAATWTSHQQHVAVVVVVGLLVLQPSNENQPNKQD